MKWNFEDTYINIAEGESSASETMGEVDYSERKVITDKRIYLPQAKVNFEKDLLKIQIDNILVGIRLPDGEFERIKKFYEEGKEKE